MAHRSLYFVAICPEGTFSHTIRAFQQEMCDLFDVCRALRTPPHLTLVPPFRASPLEEQQLEKALDQVQFAPFELSISGFGRFGRRVIFVKPEMSEMLKGLHARAEEAYAPWKKPETGRSFNPHFTIGYRDLEPVFRSAWPHFRDKPTPDRVRIESLVLFKHVAGRWQVHFRTP